MAKGGRDYRGGLILLLSGLVVGRLVGDLGPHRATAVEAQASEEQRIVAVVKAVSPAVVSVNPGHGGSGVIIRQDGIILTNDHVIGDGPVSVTLADGRKLTARVLGRDDQLDLAAIQVPVNGLPVAPRGDSDRLDVGQTAIAVGDPLGLERTVTRGVVSATHRRLDDSRLGLENMIQTDAAINPGNSGGPLLDSSGRVIGINTLIIAGRDGSPRGLGFAIPINTAHDMIQAIERDGRLIRPQLGVFPTDITPEVADEFHMTIHDGALVAQVVPGGAAERAGLERGDIVTHVNGQRVHGSADLRRVLRALKPGAKAELTVWRAGNTFTATARMEEARDR
jgi:S1-C subfamily serine protease